MKIGKLHNKSRIVNVLLGLAAAGVLLFASCQNIFDMAEAKPQDDGYGYVKVDVDLGEARTLRPDLEQIAYYVYKFSGVEHKNVVDVNYKSTEPNPQAFRLPYGKFTLKVEAYTGTGVYQIAADGVYGEGDGKFDITVNTLTELTVKLTPRTVRPGTLAIRIRLPANNTSSVILSGGTVVNPDGFTYEIKQLLADKLEVPTPALSLTRGAPVTPNAAGGYVLYTITGNVFPAYPPANSLPTILDSKNVTGSSVPAGTYLITGRINTSDGKYGGFSEAIHVYSDMLTIFDKDYTTLDNLATITKAEEAYTILRDEIVAWVTNANAAKPALAVGKDVAGNDIGIEYPAAGTIRLNYVKSKLEPVGTDVTVFPIVLQGGWTIDTANFASDSWTVGNSSKDKYIVHLINNAVKTNGNLSVAPTYIVELWPVAEYTVVFGKTVSAADKASAGRSVTIENKDPANKPTIILNGSSTEPVKGIGLVGLTDLALVKAAITISIDGAKAEYLPPDANGAYKITAESRFYTINVYQTVPEQAEAAFKTLRENLVSGDKWVEQMDALTRSLNPLQLSGIVSAPVEPGAPEYTIDTSILDPKDPFDKDPVTNLPLYYNGSNTVTLYYVRARLNNTTNQYGLGNTFFIDVPISSAHGEKGDDRWEVSDLWATPNGLTVINPADTIAQATTKANNANKGDQKTIYYRPYGGDMIPFKIIWKPVAEFYVNYAEKGDTIIPAMTGADVYTPISSVTIKDNLAVNVTNETYKFDTPNSGDFGPYSGTGGTGYRGIKYNLGSTNIAQSDVTIMIDHISQVANGVLPSGQTYNNTFNFFFKTTNPNNPVYPGPMPPNPTNFNGTIAQTEPAGTNIPVDSREYHVVVFRSIAKQITDAQAEIRAESGKPDAAAWGFADNAGTILVGSDGFVPVPTVPLRTDVVYAGAWNTITIRNDPTTVVNGKRFADRGWSGIIGTPALHSTLGYRDIALQFQPKGARVVYSTTAPLYNGSTGIYTIRTIPARLYKVNFLENPIKGTGYAKGTVEVAGFEPGTNTPTQAVQYTDTGTSQPVFIGIGGAGSTAITVKALSAGNLNVLKNRAVTGNTSVSTAAGVLSVPAITGGLNQSNTSWVTPVEIDVYPSMADQQKNFMEEINKVDWKKLPEWTSAPQLNLTTSIEELWVPPLTTDNVTKFKIVAATHPTIDDPAGYLYDRGTTAFAAAANSPGYQSFTITPVATPVIPGETPATPAAFGNQDFRITFSPNAATAAAGNNVSYTFRLTQVARFDIEMMNGPTGDGPTSKNSYLVDVSINTYRPGTNGSAASASTWQAVQFNQGTTKVTYYGGVGSFVTPVSAGPTTIKASSLNILRTDTGTQGTWQTIGFNENYMDPIGTVASRVYTIRVYPTVEDQKAQVLKRLNDLNGTTASYWTGTQAGFELLGPVVRNGTTTVKGSGNFMRTNYYDTSAAAVADTLQFQYFGNAPTITPPSTLPNAIITPLTGNQVPADYGYNLVTGTYGTANGITGVREIGINYTPIASPPTVVTNLFKIRTIPVVKYTVEYMNAASGTVTVTPSVNYFYPSSTTDTRGDQILFNESPAVQEGYTPRDASTVIAIEATKGSYDKIQYRQKGQGAGTVGDFIELPEAANGGKVPFPGKNFASDVWEILVIKNKQ